MSRFTGNLLTEETSEDRIKLVKKLWNIIHLQKIPIDIEHYNALLTVYVENEFDFEPDDILGQIQLKYLQPNRFVEFKKSVRNYDKHFNPSKFPERPISS